MFYAVLRVHSYRDSVTDLSGIRGSNDIKNFRRVWMNEKAKQMSYVYRIIWALYGKYYTPFFILSEKCMCYFLEKCLSRKRSSPTKNLTCNIFFYIINQTLVRYLRRIMEIANELTYLGIYFLHGVLARDKIRKIFFWFKTWKQSRKVQFLRKELQLLDGELVQKFCRLDLIPASSISHLSAVTAQLLTRLAHTKLTKSTGLAARCW